MASGIGATPGCLAQRGQWASSWAGTPAGGSGGPSARPAGLAGCPQSAALERRAGPPSAIRQRCRRAHHPAPAETLHHSIETQGMMGHDTPKQIHTASSPAGMQTTLHIGIRPCTWAEPELVIAEHQEMSSSRSCPRQAGRPLGCHFLPESPCNQELVGTCRQ